MGFLSGLFGGGSSTQTTNQQQSGTQSAQSQLNATQQGQQSQEQSAQQTALANALQNLSGTGASQTQTGFQYGLAPLGGATQTGQNYLTNMLGQGGPTYSGAYNNISGFQPQFSAQAFSPTTSQQYQQGMGAASDYAQNLYNRTISPQLDANANRSGMFGSSPWAAAKATGASDLAASLGQQGLNYASSIQGMGTQGLTSSFNPLANLAGGNAASALGLIQTDPRAVLLGQTGTGAQQYGQTGQSTQQANTQLNALANALMQAQAAQQGTSSGQYSQQGTSTTNTQHAASPMGILGGLLNIGSSLFGGGGLLSGLGGLFGGGNSNIGGLGLGDVGWLGNYQNMNWGDQAGLF